MNNTKIYILNSTGKQVFPFPWESRNAPCPWNREKYQRVLIPLSPAEQKNSSKKVHCQIVKLDKLSTFNNGFKLRQVKEEAIA